MLPNCHYLNLRGLVVVVAVVDLSAAALDLNLHYQNHLIQVSLK
jgi:hypothetical protein